RLVGVDLCPGHARIWPVVQFAAPQVHPDCEAAVAEGLSRRAELAVLNLLIQKLDATTLPLIRQWLRSVNALLAVENPAQPMHPLVGLVAVLVHAIGPDTHDLEARLAQLQQLRDERARTIRGDIRGDVQDLCRVAQLVAQLKERTHVAEQQVRDVAEKAGAGLANLTFADVTKARLEGRRARGELIKAVPNAERALVKQ